MEETESKEEERNVSGNTNVTLEGLLSLNRTLEF